MRRITTERKIYLCRITTERKIYLCRITTERKIWVLIVGKQLLPIMLIRFHYMLKVGSIDYHRNDVDTLKAFFLRTKVIIF